jgi:hypothetical protein
MTTPAPACTACQPGMCTTQCPICPKSQYMPMPATEPTHHAVRKAKVVPSSWLPGNHTCAEGSCAF